jgi:hypothetical protein
MIARTTLGDGHRFTIAAWIKTAASKIAPLGKDNANGNLNVDEKISLVNAGRGDRELGFVACSQQWLSASRVSSTSCRYTFTSGFLDVPVQEVLHEFVPVGITELGTAVPSTLDDVERRFQTHFLVAFVEVLALAEGDHLVLVTVKDEHRRVALGQVRHRAGGLQQFRRFVVAESFAFLGEQPEVTGAEHVHNGIDLRRLVEIAADIACGVFRSFALVIMIDSSPTASRTS